LIDLGIGCNFDENERTSYLIYEHEYGLFIQDERLNSKRMNFYLYFIVSIFLLENITQEQKVSSIIELKKTFTDKTLETYRGSSFSKMQEMQFPNKEDIDIDDDDNRSFISGNF
jgi:hypothetical protein